jgi:arsenite methyltransferase
LKKEKENMNHLIPILREMLSSQQLARIPEPMVMSDDQQTQQYYQYGLGDTALRAAYLFHARLASKTIKNRSKVLDLGCGPANQLSLIAQLNPDVMFYGVDLSDSMISIAKKNCDDLGLKNVSFIHDDITKLGKIADKSYDGVISSVALHHLNSEKDLESTFKNISRVLTENAAVYITDFLLVKNRKTIDYLLTLNSNQPELFRQDYENSLLAAFKEKDFVKLRDTFLPDVGVYQAFGAKFLTIIKSKSYELDKSVEDRINIEIKKLGPENRSIIRSLSALFYLKGL